MKRTVIIAGAMMLAAVASVTAQVTTNSTSTPMGRALMAERNGAWADAATAYGAVLQHDPANVGALTGMVHVLPKLDRTAALDSVVRAALAVDSVTPGVLGVAVRVFAVTGHADSARRYVDMWSRRDPGDDEPYREWYEAAIEARDLPEARGAIAAARERLGPAALAIESAQLLQSTGDYASAAREWVLVVQNVPSFLSGAVDLLFQAPANQRPVIRDALTHDTVVEARQVLGLLRIRWGESAAGAAMVRDALPPADPMALQLLQQTIDALQGRDDPASRQAVGATWEALAARTRVADQVRPLMQAARAYADGGDDRDARRLLDRVAKMPNAPPDLATTASATLMSVLLAEHKPDDAEKLLHQLGAHLTPDQHDDYARRIALAWAARGAFVHADSLVAGDSSTAGFDLRGRLRVYRGDLAGANDLLKFAGPYDDDRGAALRRVHLLTLIQAIGRDTSAAFGAAMLALDRGDSVRAVAGLDTLAATLRPAGAAALRIAAGRVALAIGDTVTALRLLHGADVADAPAAAAEARLITARVAVARGARTEARQTLEHLLTDFPESAMTPSARQLYDSLPADSARPSP